MNGEGFVGIMMLGYGLSMAYACYYLYHMFLVGFFVVMSILGVVAILDNKYNSSGLVIKFLKFLGGKRKKEQVS